MLLTVDTAVRDYAVSSGAIRAVQSYADLVDRITAPRLLRTSVAGICRCGVLCSDNRTATVGSSTLLTDTIYTQVVDTSRSGVAYGRARPVGIARGASGSHDRRTETRRVTRPVSTGIYVRHLGAAIRIRLRARLTVRVWVTMPTDSTAGGIAGVHRTRVAVIAVVVPRTGTGSWVDRNVETGTTGSAIIIDASACFMRLS